MGKISRKNKIDFKNHLLQFGILYLLVLLIIVASFLSKGRFFTIENGINVLRQSSTTVIMALGMGLVIITGGIDLSVGSLAAMTGMMVSGAITFWGFPVYLAIIFSLIIGSLVGFVNGIIIAKFNITPMIMTLATMNAARGIAYLYNDGAQVIGLPDRFTNIGRGYVGSIPVPVIIMIILIVINYFVTTKTIFGRYLYAIGGNEEVARRSGVNTIKIKLTAYILCSLMASIAGIILTARLNMGDPSMGSSSGLEMDAVASVVLGGINLYGGKGSIIGAVIGAFFISILGNALNLIGISQFWQLLVKALVLITAALIYTDKKS